MSVPPASSGRRRPGLARQFPEPARFWIAYSPRVWPAAGSPWTDLAAARVRGLGSPRGDEPAGLPALDAAGLDDLLWLPPVAAELRGERDRRAASLIESGSPLLLAVAPGEASQVGGVNVIYDLLRPLLVGELDRLARLAAGATAVWPLIAGLTDSPEMWEEGCSALAAARAACVQPLSVELDPAARRRLVELGGAATFDAVFHSQAPSERDFSRCAARHGLQVFMPRPAISGTLRQARNRRLASDLALAGELWLRLGRSVSGGQALIRAARRAEFTSRDLAAVARERNLEVLDWLDAASRALVSEVVVGGRSSLLDALCSEYLGS